MYPLKFNLKIFTTTLLKVFLLAPSFLLLAPEAFAQSFTTSRQLTYTITSVPDIQVEENITITNLTTTQYPESYLIDLGSAIAHGAYTQDQFGQPLPTQIIEQDSGSLAIQITLTPSLGQGAISTFTTNYFISDAVDHTGNMTEFVLPKISSKDITDELITIQVSRHLDKLAYMHPYPFKTEETSEYNQYIFQPAELNNTHLKAAFGQHQLYQFTIYHHLENQPIEDDHYLLTLPPDTAYQQVILTQFSQPPDEITTDIDGNWVGHFPVNKTNSPVVTTGVVRVFHQPIIPVHNPPSQTHTQPTDHWQQIQLSNQNLTTPEDIYRFTLQTLSYNYQKQGFATDRLGAQQALQNPTYANCMEFTDLFIALARSAGIPSRRVVGYAHSDNPQQRPLIATNDVLHTWPEYWDAQRQAWISIDPTWESTSQGTDYFNTWDSRHVVLSINGQDSHNPIPPGFQSSQAQTKNIIFTPIQSFPEQPLEIELKASLPWYSIPVINHTGTITFHSQSTFALHQVSPFIESSGSFSPTSQSSILETLTPYGTGQTTFKYKLNKLILPKQLIITINGQRQKIPVPWWSRFLQLIFYTCIITIYVILTIYTLKLAFKTRSLSLQKSKR